MVPPAGNPYVSINEGGATCLMIFSSLNCTGVANPGFYNGVTPNTVVQWDGAYIPLAIVEIVQPTDVRVPDDPNIGFRSVMVCCVVLRDTTDTFGPPLLDISVTVDVPSALEETLAWVPKVQAFGSVVLQTLNENKYGYLIDTSFILPNPKKKPQPISIDDLAYSQR